MIRFLRWCRDILFSVLNGIAKLAVLLVILFLVLLVIGLARGDGQPRTMVLALDLREAITDSRGTATASFLTPHKVTVMDIVLGLDAAGRDNRVKGVLLQIGDGALSTAQAEEIATALHRFRGHGKFVIAQATGFNGAGLGDYLAASAADEIWVQPKSSFATAGTGVGEMFLKGLFDKIQAEPQIAKRADYKSAADMYMEKSMTPADHEQLTALMTSVYNAAVAEMASARHLTVAQVTAALEASPQFSEDALSRKLVDRIGYDDEAKGAALSRAGDGAKAVKMADYVENAHAGFGPANIAIVEGSGEIHDGTNHDTLFSSDDSIAGDDLSAALRQAAADSNIKAIILRVDSPGGSVSASDQILHAVKMAQKAGKPVVVSMASLAASGGYYISTSANRIVAEPGTITGSIGVLTGKVSFGKTAGLVGVGVDQVAVGKNALMNSPLQPYSDDQWANLNHQADVIYDDFTAKVAAGRHLPIATVKDIARGRVWSGGDAKARGLVDTLGGFWDAAGAAASLGHVAPDGMVFRVYPRPRGFFARLFDSGSGMDADIAGLGRLESLLNMPAVQAVETQVRALPTGAPGSAVQLRADPIIQP